MSEAFWAWFAAAPGRYWLVALPFGVALVAGVFFPRRVPAWAFLLILALALVAFRLPALGHGAEFNPDESQMLAAAITLQSAPVFWRDVDAHAIGPLDVYPLTLLGALGLPLNYTTARVFGLGMIWLSLFGLHRLLRDTHGEGLGRAGVVVGAGYFCLLRQYELIGYSSETVAAGLVGLGMAGFWIGARRGAIGPLFAGALALGAVPWAKTQGIPAALAFGVGTLVFLWRIWAPEPARRRRLLLWASAGGLAPTLVFAIMLTVHGLWSEWGTAYVRAAFDYTSSGTHPMLETLSFFASVEPLGFYAFLLPLLGVVVLLLGSVLFHAGEGRALALTLGGAAVGAAFAVALPGRIIPHYLILAVVPLAGFATALLATFLSGPAVTGWSVRWPWLRAAAIGAFVLVALLPEIEWTFRPASPRYDYKAGTKLMIGRTAAIIRQVSAPGDTLAMWGWAPMLHVQSGLPQATREAHSERMISDYRLEPFYRARYLADLKRTSPRFFADAVGPGSFAFTDRARQGHESWPELAAWVAAHYRLVDDAGGMRLYIATAQFPSR